MASTLTVVPGPPTVLSGRTARGKTTLLRLAMSLFPPTVRHVTCGAARRRRAPRHRVSEAGDAAANGSGERRLRAQPERTCARERTLVAGRPRCTLPFARRGASRAASSSALPWRARSRAIPRCCFSTSRRQASIRPRPTSSRTSSRRYAASGVKIVMATHDLGQARRLAGDDRASRHAADLIEHTPAPSNSSRILQARRPPRSCAATSLFSKEGDIK